MLSKWDGAAPALHDGRAGEVLQTTTPPGPKTRGSAPRTSITIRRCRCRRCLCSRPCRFCSRSNPRTIRRCRRSACSIHRWGHPRPRTRDHCSTSTLQLHCSSPERRRSSCMLGRRRSSRGRSSRDLGSILRADRPRPRRGRFRRLRPLSSWSLSAPSSFTSCRRSGTRCRIPA